MALTNHTRGKHSKQERFNQETQHCQKLRGFVQAHILMRNFGGRESGFFFHAMMTSPMVHMHTGGKANYNQSHGIRAGNKGVKDKEQKVFVIANAHTIVDPVVRDVEKVSKKKR